ncbi:guanylate kinase [Halotia branconii]|uniref:Guanylate kinase n=1 Tax=Halotia branconii CENA392 TaxID=1539056 RepID=A0AAJ6PCD3_9CYAN|nr:guanylate kinase [Halotia branconii]WGV28766.1 guanylate kinase [Halotia branconii CENA392]
MMQALPIQSCANTQEDQSPGRLIVLTGPSGVGKGTLMRSLLQRHPQLYYSVSVTTRSPRPGEIEGKNYYFISRSKFEQLIAKGEFLEWAEFAGNYYGTLRETVLNQVRSGKLVVLEIELEGARQIRTFFPHVLSIFILPPDFDELEKRIRGRGQDSEEAIARRLCRAKEEVKAAGEFDIKVVNDNFETALNAIETALFNSNS